MAFAYQGGELQEFMKRAVRGLKYGEDLFCAQYTYSHEGEEPEQILGSFFRTLMTEEEQKKPYMRWLQKIKMQDQLKSQLTMPGFFEKMRQLGKDTIYKRLIVHIPASDLIDLMAIDYDSRIYFYKFPRAEGMIPLGDESGNILYLTLNKTTLGVLHTVFN